MQQHIFREQEMDLREDEALEVKGIRKFILGCFKL